ncbi:2-C-methyl-D-erythritol 4-phosphate cytidylyltransferase [Faecalibacterium prausnitzii]|nr:2-C-methyl-D-erythritol 4-phosphate cytidylyltransferase [Faecalibacterium prausnitzii]
MTAVLVAAGSSTRMGFDKLSFDLGGETVLERSVRAFDECPEVDELVIVTGASGGNARRAAARCKKPVRLVKGGSTRAESAVLSADSSLNLKNLNDLEAYVKAGNPVSVAVNGATGSEAFLAAALFGSMGAGDQLKLTPYQSAAEAAQAVAKGETNFAVSHQSQILETYQQGGVDVVCAFDDKSIENGPFAGVEGVGSKGYPFFRNRCFVMARKGTDAAKVAELKELYDKILADQEMAKWLNDTMLLEVDTMSEDDVKAHIENVKSIVEQYKDIVAG